MRWVSMMCGDRFRLYLVGLARVQRDRNMEW